MRSPDATLIRARAKAPLSNLLALHLSNADIECIKHLEVCKSLQSLYVDNNHIKDLEGVIELRKLWRIDLNGNLLKNLHPLASFRALGFLYLERNRICFEDLVCLRDQHFLELRLLGNESLLKGNTTDEYRKKVVAVLPNVWILDGHFVSTAERQQAIGEFDSFVVSFLDQPQKRSNVGDSKFGSVADVWVGSEFVMEDSVELALRAQLIDTAHKSTPPSEPTDLGRLYAIVSFHNAESAVHNAYCHFAPSKHALNSRMMSKIWLDDVLALPRRTRIEVIVLLAAFLQFHFPKALLSEALAIRQLDSPNFPSEAIRDIANLPPYALVALVAITRHVSLEAEKLMREEHRPEVATPDFEEESELLGAIPPLFTTLLSGTVDSDQQATSIRCRRAIKMLSNVASFPDPEVVAFKGKGKREAIFRELMPLFRAAESNPVNHSSQGGRGVIVPCFAVSSHKTALRSPKTVKPRTTMWKRSAKPQSCETLVDTADGSTVSPDAELESQQLTASLYRVTDSPARRIPKPGDWVEVSAKQFVKIHFLSSDGLFIVAALPTDSSRSITLSIEQLSRASSSVWRVNYLTKHQAEELCANTKSDSSSSNSTRIGKLHRDSEGFHRHGAARNQGFPNHNVTAQMIQDMERSIPKSSSQTKSIEIFSSNDTLDANYVLTSPDHIAAQNYCAVTTSLHERRPPLGLWSPVKQAASYTLLANNTPPLNKSASLNELNTRKPRVQQKVATAPQQQQFDDDWLEIRRAMQAQLGIADSDHRPLSTACRTYTCSSLQSHSSFMTAAPEVQPVPIERSRVKTPSQRIAASRTWHQVATKNEFIVAAPSAPLGASLSSPECLVSSSAKLKLTVLPSLSQKSK